MRTTLDIAEDVLFAAKDLARRDKRTLGAVISDLARLAMQAPRSNEATKVEADSAREQRLGALGIHPFKLAQGRPVSNDSVNALRDLEGI